MNLDINTPKGQASWAHEKELQAWVEQCWNVKIIETPKDKISKCDGFLTREGNLIALFETKCRYDMTYNQLLQRGTWLVTNEKIEACRKLSEDLQVPFLGFLYLRPSHSDERVMLFWKITNSRGEYQFDIDVYEQETQKTINGGQITRLNSYLPVNKSQFIKSVVREQVA